MICTRIRRISQSFFCLPALVLGFGAPAVVAQPTADPIVVIVPYSQNGPTDRTMRALAKPLSQALGGTPITVKNVPSPGGVDGLAEVARAKPDGRTLLFTNTNVALLPALGDKLPFDPKNAFSYLGLVLETVSRGFSRLHDDGVIEVRGRRVRIFFGAFDVSIGFSE